MEKQLNGWIISGIVLAFLVLFLIFSVFSYISDLKSQQEKSSQSQQLNTSVTPVLNPTSTQISNSSMLQSNVGMMNSNMSVQPPTSKIVMRFIWVGGSFSAPIQNGKITVDVGNQQFLKQTNKKGWLVLDKVPCNQNAKITFGNGGLMSRNVDESPFPVETSNDNQVTRYVTCSGKPVPLGAFSWEDGNFIGDDMDNIDTCYTCQ